MTLQAEEGLLLLKQVVGHGAVWIMTHQTVFNHRVMFKNKWALITGVTCKTQIIEALVGTEHSLIHALAAMGVVTVGTCHLALFYRMMRHEIHLRHHILVTLGAELWLLLFRKQIFIAVSVYFMTLGAGYIVFRMG